MKNQKFKRLSHWLYRAANHDFCPSCNRFTDWLKQPLGWVISAILFSLLVGLVIGPQGYILAFAFIALLVLGMTWPWLSMKGIQCQIVLPEFQVEENEQLECILRVKNFWPLPVFGLMISGDFLQDFNEDEEPVAFSLKRVGAWSESEFRIPVIPRRRGRLPVGEVAVTNGFPFGLMHVSKAASVPQRTTVWPMSVPLESFPVSGSTRLCLQGALSARVGNDGDSIGVRDYHYGDRMRNIHWAQSVRSQKLMVRERQSISSAAGTVILDLSPNDHGGSGIENSFEWTIRIAASICRHLHETRSPVQIECYGWSAPLKEDNRKGLHPIMDFLADLPTLAQAMNLVEPVKTIAEPEEEQSRSICNHLFSGNDRIFIIGSNQSKLIRTGSNFRHGAKVTPVVVDIDGFHSEVDFPWAEKTASKNESDLSNENAIFIGAPHSAAAELATGWNRSFSDAG